MNEHPVITPRQAGAIAGVTAAAVRDRRRCPATRRHIRPHSLTAAGLQCHYEAGHDGDHAGYAGPSEGDIFWPQDAS